MKKLLAGLILIASFSSLASSGVIDVLNVSHPHSKKMPNLRENPLAQSTDNSLNAIYSELVSAYLNLPKANGEENDSLSIEEKRITELGGDLYNSMIKAGLRPVETLDEANLVLHYEVKSCDFFGDGGDCFYTSNSSCQSDYKTVVRIATLDGLKSDMWSAKEGQSSFMAVNFSNYNNKTNGICKYQYESMKSAFSKVLN